MRKLHSGSGSGRPQAVTSACLTRGLTLTLDGSVQIKRHTPVVTSCSGLADQDGPPLQGLSPGEFSAKRCVYNRVCAACVVEVCVAEVSVPYGTGKTWTELHDSTTPNGANYLGKWMARAFKRRGYSILQKTISQKIPNTWHADAQACA